MTVTRIEADDRMSQIVIHGETIYLSGQCEPGETVAEQTRAVLAEIERLLALAGSSKAHILMAQIWLADMADFAAMNTVWDAWVADGPKPARATGESKLASDAYKIEIIVTAAKA
ncbi:RidA family protein [Novosphingobium profundi]|uniref:RidA family protein n=1 Tax=Novosphingobium profundi TaxID=1774954 RepID=UPI001BD9BE4D|nr:RidA family protein [Novosphingobium profundi]MBT0670136.1 RidA family protein [Novosphingobium profundi]